MIVSNPDKISCHLPSLSSVGDDSMVQFCKSVGGKFKISKKWNSDEVSTGSCTPQNINVSR